jgi:rhodanese-related sulfurtransferase
MYHSLREKLMKLNDDVLVYPAHGAGTLCGKNLSKDATSTIGQEKQTNWSLQEASEDEFVKNLLSDQPFIPSYFPYDVELNRKGAKGFQESIGSVTFGAPIKTEQDRSRIAENIVVVDARPGKEYKRKHLSNSVNLMEGEKFETWLGSIIKPEEPFYLAGQDVSQLKRLIERAASIGYEGQIVEAFVLDAGEKTQQLLDLSAFRSNLEQYTIVDVRNHSEVSEGRPFANSLSLPLSELRNRLPEIPTDKPIVVHCAGGYRSAAGSSIVNSALGEKVKVFDLSEAVKEF